MPSRRNFCKGLMAGLALPAAAARADSPLAAPPKAAASPQAVEGFGALLPDPKQVIDLPAGFSYQILSVTGQKMADGLSVPGWPDGMHAFALDEHRVSILCNHELDVSQQDMSAWQGSRPPNAAEKKFSYDLMAEQPAPGAVRRIIYDVKKAAVVQQHLALAGTLRNCSGGPTPWGSWISCEETTRRAGQHGLNQHHGFGFEVPAKGKVLSVARPLKAMGRFFHESAVVDPSTGIVYMSEDRADGLFYRFIPRQPKKLDQGGRLQALALRSSDRSVATGNQGASDIPVGKRFAVRWLDLADVESADDSLRYQGESAGAAVFVRGEGLAVDETVKRHTAIWIVASTGGRKGLGQLFRYFPSKYEGGFREQQAPGKLELFSEPNDGQLIRNADNLALMPNGDILLCEDHYGVQRLVGMTRAGQFYVLAANPRKASEFTGPTFSPDGSTLFVNMQQQGGTLAIRGPWSRAV